MENLTKKKQGRNYVDKRTKGREGECWNTGKKEQSWASSVRKCPRNPQRVLCLLKVSLMICLLVNGKKVDFSLVVFIQQHSWASMN